MAEGLRETFGKDLRVEGRPTLKGETILLQTGCRETLREKWQRRWALPAGQKSQPPRRPGCHRETEPT